MDKINKSVDINTEPKRVIYFDKVNECMHCGSKCTLIIIDKFGNRCSKEINAFDHIKCTKCNTEYSIRWIADEDGTMHPVAVPKSVKRDYMNMMNA